MNYFTECTTQDEAKNLFKKLVKKLHPDTSGYNSHGDFIQMHKEFKAFNPSNKTHFDADFDHDKFYNLVRNFDGLKDINIDFVGSFIWFVDAVEGATRSQKDLIKEIKIEGMNPPRWARNRKQWFISPEGYKQKFKSKKTMNEIKATYGSQTYKAKGFKQVAA